jgi:S-adenosylmethionine hydrolase
VSGTFDGRDLFAPVAGHLSLGVTPASFGHKTGSWTELAFAKPRIVGEKVIGEVIHIDAFGNLISNIDEGQLGEFARGQSLVVRIGKAHIEGLKKAYWEGKKYEPIALIGSGGLLEISVREGNAREILNVDKWEKIVVQLAVGPKLAGNG